MEKWSQKADNARVQKVIATLKANNIEAEIVTDNVTAVARIKELIPQGSQVHQGASKTLDQTGITSLIEESGSYDAIRPKIQKLDYTKDAKKISELTATPQYMLGSVHAVSEDGHILVASASGSQLPAEVGGAEHVIWVVGTQKIVVDRAEAFERLEKHTFPLEDARAMEAYGQHSSINKIILINKESRPGRSHLIFIDEAIGF